MSQIWGAKWNFNGMFRNSWKRFWVFPTQRNDQCLGGKKILQNSKKAGVFKKFMEYAYYLINAWTSKLVCIKISILPHCPLSFLKYILRIQSKQRSWRAWRFQKWWRQDNGNNAVTDASLPCWRKTTSEPDSISRAPELSAVRTAGRHRVNYINGACVWAAVKPRVLSAQLISPGSRRWGLVS